MQANLTVTLGNGMVQRREPLNIRGVERTAVAEEEGHHGGGSHGRSAMDGVLASFIADASRCLVLDEEACCVEILLGRDKVQGRLVRLGTVAALAY